MFMTLLVARLLLAAVFGVAGLAKLTDRIGSQQALRDFGIPAMLAPLLGLLLPLAELAIAIALLPVTTAWWGALSAFALLLLFATGIGITLARGHQPACRCFGQLSSAPIGWTTLFRNMVLAAVAAFVVWEGQADVGPSAVHWLGELTLTQGMGLIGGVLSLGLLVANGWFLIHLLRQNGRLLLRIEALEMRFPSGSAPRALSQQGILAVRGAGLPLGVPAPAFHLADLDGETLTLDALCAPGHPVMLIFSHPNCYSCMTLLPEVARWQRDYATALTITLISQGTRDDNHAKHAEYELIQVLLQQDGEVAEAYQISGTPSAVLVNPDGTIGSPLAEGADAIRSLVSQTMVWPALVPAHGPCPRCGQHHGNGTVTAPVIPPGAIIGAPAPALALPDLTGKMIDLADFRGRPTLVLFWNPSCGFCQQMLPELQAWETHPPEAAPQMLIVSTGTVEANHALGLRAPIVFDHTFLAGQKFGATGTPMAVLLDAEGNIASEVVAGAPAVMALANTHNQFNVVSG